MEDMHRRILITLLIGLILVVGFYLITNAITKYTGFFVASETKGSDFEECLKEQDITLYVNTEDMAKTLKTIQLLDNLKDVKIMNCLRDNVICSERNVNSFPSWIINGKVISKDINFEELSEYSGCKLIVN